MPLIRNDNPWVTLARRFLLIVAGAYWMGGFAFYGSVVVPNASAIVAGGEGEFGFITRVVTNWLNLIGGLALLAFLWEVVGEWRRDWTGLVRLGCWGGMVITLGILVGMHVRMDRQLEPETLTIRSRASFHLLHKVYILISTVQWGLSLAFLAVSLYLWGGRGRQTGVGQRLTEDFTAADKSMA